MTTSDFDDLGNLLDTTDHEREQLRELEADLHALRRLQPVIEDALGSLPYDDYATIHARFYDGDSLEELAPQFGLDSAEAAQNRLRLALDRFQDELLERGLDASLDQIRPLLQGLGRVFRTRLEELPPLPKDSQGPIMESTAAETVAATVEPEKLGEDPDVRRRRGLRFLVQALAAQQALRVYRRVRGYGAVRSASGEGEDAEVTSAEGLDRAAQELMKGGPNGRVRFEGSAEFGSEAVALNLCYDPGQKGEGYLVFSGLSTSGTEGLVDSFAVHLRSESSGEILEFESDDGEVRVPVEAFDRLLDGAFTISITH